MRATFVSLNKFIIKIDSTIYPMILININIFYISSQSYFSKNENSSYLDTEGVMTMTDI
jgi:hypothetical protein